MSDDDISLCHAQPESPQCASTKMLQVPLSGVWTDNRPSTIDSIFVHARHSDICAPTIHAYIWARAHRNDCIRAQICCVSNCNLQLIAWFIAHHKRLYGYQALASFYSRKPLIYAMRETNRFASYSNDKCVHGVVPSSVTFFNVRTGGKFCGTLAIWW